MGTYIQGVESIIPALQPTDPGLNVVGNLLQLKQSQYDTNYQQLGKMYGQYYYGDLTREDNIKKRDNTVRQIDFDLKRIAGLDLSQEKNVDQAMQVFRPFYEDTSLMKDMAWTKNFNRQVGEAEGLRLSTDPEARARYWDEGIRALQYKKEEFKNADPNAALGFENPIYTSNVNIQEKAMKLAKDAGLSVERTTLSDDGMWIIKNKNGEVLTEPLTKLFEAQLGSDPEVQDYYATEAYVSRKDFSYGKASEYGGADKAEMKYLEDMYTGMRDRVADRHAAVEERSQTYDSKIKDIQDQIKQKGSNPLLEKTLKEYQDGKAINDKVMGQLDNQLKQFDQAYRTTDQGKEFQNPYQDMNQLRRVVDSNVSYNYMSEDIMKAAEYLSMKDAKQDIKENPYAVIDIKHKNQLSEINAANAWRYKIEQLKGQNAIDKIAAQAYYGVNTGKGTGTGGKGTGKGTGTGSGSGTGNNNQNNAGGWTLGKADQNNGNQNQNQNQNQGKGTGKGKQNQGKGNQGKGNQNQSNQIDPSQKNQSNQPKQQQNKPFVASEQTQGALSNDNGVLWRYDPNKTPQQNIEAARNAKKQNQANNKAGTAFTAADIEGNNLNDQRKDKLVSNKATTVYNESVQGALIQALDMLTEAKRKGNVSGDEVFQMFAPKNITKNIFNNRGVGGSDPLAEWKKKYDPDYDKGTIYDMSVYTSPEKLKALIQKDGVDFLLARTNVGRGNEYSKEMEDNYLGEIVKNINTWTGQNANLSEVSQAVQAKGLTQSLSNAYAVATNIQDFKDWRNKAKDAIIDDMYNSMKDRPDIIQDFGTPEFDKNGKFTGYNMSNLKFQLDKSFTADGDFNANYRPFTNYEENIREYEYIQGKVWDGNTWVNPSKDQTFSFGQSRANDPTGVGGMSTYGLLQKDDPYRYKTVTNRGLSSSPSENVDVPEGVTAYTQTRVSGDYPEWRVPITSSEVSKTFAKQFYKSAMNIYGNKDDRNVLDKPVPFFASVGSGYGVGSQGLAAHVNLSKPNSQESLAFMTWASDWNQIRGLINGETRRMSFKGVGSYGWDEGHGKDGDVGEVNKKGVALMNKFMAWAEENKTEANSFQMLAAPFANDNIENTAMKFMLPEKFLKSELIDEKKNPNGSIDQDDYDLLSKYGLSVIGQQGDFNNLLMRSNITPFQAHVDYRGSYTWKHPSGLGEYTVRAGGKGEPDYITSLKFFDYDGKEVANGINNVTRFGSNLDESFSSAVNTLNNYVYNELSKVSQQRENIQNPSN